MLSAASWLDCCAPAGAVDCTLDERVLTVLRCRTVRLDRRLLLLLLLLNIARPRNSSNSALSDGCTRVEGEEREERVGEKAADEATGGESGTRALDGSL